jgi:hypothetical protein
MRVLGLSNGLLGTAYGSSGSPSCLARFFERSRREHPIERLLWVTTRLAVDGFKDIRIDPLGEILGIGAAVQ